jgi:integrase
MDSESEAQEVYRVSDLVADFLQFAHVHYRKDGQSTQEAENITYMVRPLLEALGDLPVDAFRPQDLVTYRDLLIEAGLARSQINKQVQVIRRIFKHGVFEGFVPAGILEALRTVRPLQKGRTKARETEPVRPVDEEAVFAVLPYLSQTVAAMVLLQWHTGMRPGEVVQMRGQDLDRSGPVWLYRPRRHKTQHYGHERVVRLGKNAQETLKPLLTDDQALPLFNPSASAKNLSRVGATYTTQTYGRAVRRACLRAGVEPWSLNRLRHSAATRITHEFGIELARVILGHRSISTTQLYAELDNEKANEVMQQFG